MSTTDLIVVDRLTKWYGRRCVVSDVSFCVAAGEVMGLLGPNGSGKTTILRILTGYLRPSGGTAAVSGIDVLGQPLEARRHVGYVPEDVPLYDWMRASELLAFMARIKGLAGMAVSAAVDRVMERLAIRDIARTPIGKLSRGYRQRVAIAQALLANPAVLVLDEPTNGLDPGQIIEMRSLIRGLAETTTLIVTSHILSEMEKVAERVAILLRGELLAVRSLHTNGKHPRVRMRIQGDPEAARACLAGVGGVRDISSRPSEPGTFLVDVDSPAVTQALVAALVAGHFALVELGEASADLETLFLELTNTPATRVG